MNMKINKNIKYIILIAFIFLIKINTVSAASDITCKYEMYPVGYYRKDGSVIANFQEKAVNTALLTYSYTSSNDKYTIVHNNSLTSAKNNKVKDNAFNKSVKKSGKCPSYIYATGTKVDEIDSTKFASKVDKIYDGSASGYKYPMVLVSENGKKTTTQTKFLLNYAMNSWKTIITNVKKEFSNTKCDSRLLDPDKKNQVTNVSSECKTAVENYEAAVKSASILKQQINKSSLSDSEKSKLTNWKTFSDFVTKTESGSSAVENEEALRQAESRLNNVTSDYCSLYCSETHCKNYSGTAKSQCVNTCNTTTKSKCDSVYDSCKKIQNSASQESCIKNGLTSAGLDASYTSDRASAISELQNEVRELRRITSNATAPGLKITIGEGYKVQCDDVSMFHDLWVMLIIAAPALVIVLGTFDFLKAIIAGDEQKIKKAWDKFPKRILALIFLILVPQLISIIVNMSNDETASDSSLMYCIINGGN